MYVPDEEQTITKEIPPDAHKTSHNYCKGCVHAYQNRGNRNDACLYYLHTRKRRKCPTGWCNHRSEDPNDVLVDLCDDLESWDRDTKNYFANKDKELDENSTEDFMYER